MLPQSDENEDKLDMSSQQKIGLREDLSSQNSGVYHRPHPIEATI